MVALQGTDVVESREPGCTTAVHSSTGPSSRSRDGSKPTPSLVPFAWGQDVFKSDLFVGGEQGRMQVPFTKLMTEPTTGAWRDYKPPALLVGWRTVRLLERTDPQLPKGRSPEVPLKPRAGSTAGLVTPTPTRAFTTARD